MARRRVWPPWPENCDHLATKLHLTEGDSCPAWASNIRGRRDRPPDGAWVAQQARNLRLVLSERGRRVRILVRDRDAKFTRAFDDVFGSDDAEVLITPVQAPNANAYAERWIRTVRAECLDWLLITGRGHLEQVLRVYVEHYNGHRPHRSLQLESPDAPTGTVVISDNQRRVLRRDRLNGLLHEYYRQAA